MKESHQKLQKSEDALEEEKLISQNLNIAGIVPESVVDGPGLRMTVFCQGCFNDCPGCHNPETHNFYDGKIIPLTSILEEFKKNPLLAGITFSGGEPFLQPIPLTWLACEVHKLRKDVVIFTGFIADNLAKFGVKDDKLGKYVLALMEQADYIIDGPYIERLRSLDLLYRGSANQRILKARDIADIIAKAKEAAK